MKRVHALPAYLSGWIRWPVLALANRWSRRRVTDPAATLTVCLTTYGVRGRRVHLVLESIARGRQRPVRLVLAVSAGDLPEPLPAGLIRLRSRGLEILTCVDTGPHKKYFPLTTSGGLRTALVTADDDVFYPRDWLAGLMRAQAQDPQAVWCYRARRLRLDGERLAPYSTWPLWIGHGPSPRLVPTGVSGVLHPPALSDEVLRQGQAFATVAPFADDLWLHFLCVLAGVPLRQVESRARHFAVAPAAGSASGLVRTNIAGGNDAVAARLYTEEVVSLILEADKEGAG